MAERKICRPRAYYTLACNLDYAKSCFNTGIFLDDGIGGPRDVAGALAAFRKGCTLDHADSCTEAEKME